VFKSLFNPQLPNMVIASSSLPSTSAEEAFVDLDIPTT